MCRRRRPRSTASGKLPTGHARKEWRRGGKLPRQGGPERGSNLVGTPPEVVDRIHELEEDFGADEIMCTWMGRTLSREDVVQTMQLMADEVMPNVK